jgi:hypothetical protein
MLMPGFMGVQLPPGEHEVRMEYRSRGWRKVLLTLGFLSLVSIAIWEKRGSNISDWLKSWAVRVFTNIDDDGPGALGAL